MLAFLNQKRQQQQQQQQQQPQQQPQDQPQQQSTVQPQQQLIDGVDNLSQTPFSFTQPSEPIELFSEQPLPVNNPEPSNPTPQQSKNPRAGSRKRNRNVRKKKYRTSVQITQATLQPAEGGKIRRKMYKVTLTYKLSPIDHAQHSMTVWFGDSTRQYFVDHHDLDRLRIDVTRLRREDLQNPFCSRYWEFQLLNNKDFTSVADAWRHYVLKNILK